MNEIAFPLNINWAAPSWDLFIALFFVASALIYGFSLGRDRIIVILVSLYMALAVVNSAPFIHNLNTQINISTSLFAFQVSTFLGVFLALFFFLSRSALLRSLGTASGAGPWWQVLLFSILHSGLLVSIVLSFMPTEMLNILAEPTREIFTSEFGRFIWITMPIIAMMGLNSENAK